MTHEQRAKWIRRSIMLLLAVGIVIGVWLFPQTKPAVTTRPEEAPKYDLEVIHYHLPGNPESEQLADILDKVGKKYGEVVLMTCVDIAAHPEKAIAEKVTKPPKIVMMAGTVRACKFQGLWTQAQIERKIEEILRGLKRVDNDWRPEVKGMQPAANPASPSK